LIAVLVINLIVVGYIAIDEYKKQKESATFINFSDIKFWYLGIGILCFLVAVLMLYYEYKKMIMVASGKSDSRGAFECAMLGKYYDNVTPLGAGGQPFQMIYLKQRGFSNGVSGSIPIIGFLAQQVAFILIAIVVFISNRNIVDTIVLVRVQAYVGLFFYMLVPAAIVFFALFPKPFIAFLNAIAKFLNKLRIVKDKEKAVEKITTVMNEYVSSFKIINKRPHFTILLLFLSIIYQVAILSIPFFMLKAFGGTGDWWDTFSRVVYIYAAITVIPSPGNSGAAEGYFYAVFSQLKEGFLFWAVIAWRFLVYYMWIIVGIIITAKSAIIHKKHMKIKPPQEGPLNVALFVDLYYPRVDGVIKTVNAYAKYMTKMYNGNVTVFCPYEKDFDYSQLPYDVYKIKPIKIPGWSYSFPNPFVTKEMKNYFKEKHFDVIHCHSPFITGRQAIKLGKIFKVPVVSTFHSKFYDDTVSITHSKLLAKIVVNVVVDHFCKCDMVWACSGRTADTLRQYGYNGTIHVMNNGIDPLDESINVEQLKKDVIEKYDIPKDKKILLFVGQMIWQKNLKVILDTTKILEDRKENYYLIIAGEGYHRKDILKYASSINLENYKYIGEVNGKEIFGVYASADLFFFPSMYDNAPLVVREAALVGVPSLLTKGSNSAEVIEEDENGYVAELDANAMAEKIEFIFSDDEKRAQVSKKAQETIPEPWELIIERATSYYRRALDTEQELEEASEQVQVNQ
jgi:uncharacterized protein (TIRG00374 family)